MRRVENDSLKVRLEASTGFALRLWLRPLHTLISHYRRFYPRHGFSLAHRLLTGGFP